ncbi:MAG: ABC transporter permease [Thermoprotei archaeon]
MNIETIQFFFISVTEAATPLLLASLGEIYSERSGVMNLGIEGMMLIGAYAAFVTSNITGNVWLAVLVAGLAGALLSSIHAFLSITLKVNQIVSGLALSLMGIGMSGLLGQGLIGLAAPRLPHIEIPILSSIPILGPALFGQDPLVLVSVILAPVLWFILFKTMIGLKIRSVGENPEAADVSGINVDLVRYISVMFGGFLSGIAGSYFSLVLSAAWIENMTAGRGWIALGLVIFSFWNPLYALIGSYIFGILEVLQYRFQIMFNLPTEMFSALPYGITLIALVIFSTEYARKIGAPAALGKPYVRGER